MKEMGTVAALGTFDGVHMGHRTLIEKALHKAEENGFKTIIYTFSNHPMTVMSSSPKLLMTSSERICCLKSFGCSVVADEFDTELANTSARDFALMLKERFNMKIAVAGYNYSFGKGGRGDVEMLKQLGEELGFETVIAQKVTYGSEGVSSSRIRKCIENGDIRLANAMTVSPFSLSGEVIANKHIGSTIGFPTANIGVCEEKVLPKAGVYAVTAHIRDKVFNGVTNIGTNPTVNGTKTTIETHIIGFDGDIYGEELKIEFIDRIRDDKKFASIDELKAQIAKDILFFA
ncbi:MAG: bifunctional riboflavin kinase/FAD synthetase [Clostridia bacterium]|nr:bifunctional riboflavin kinase/FAD synthetase [Clostridia bacterium]